MYYSEMIESRKKLAQENAQMSDGFLNLINYNTAPYEQLIAYYKCAVMTVETKFKVLNEEFSLRHDRNPIEGIKCRVKTTESLLRKMRARNLPMTLASIEENIWDMAGVRIVCSFPDDIYTLAECLIQQDDVTLIQREDYIKNPKPSGYRSLHLIIEVPIFLKEEKKNVKVEVQLRTIAMDCWASLEHKLRYKRNIPKDLQEQLTRELQECAEISASLDIRMQKIRDMIPERDYAPNQQQVQDSFKAGFSSGLENRHLR